MKHFPDPDQIKILEYLAEHCKTTNPAFGFDATALQKELSIELDEFGLLVEDLASRGYIDKSRGSSGNPWGSLVINSDGRDFLQKHCSKDERIKAQERAIGRSKAWEISKITLTAFLAALFLVLLQILAKCLGWLE